MNKLEFNTKLLDQYLNLLSNLSVNAKKYLIEKLRTSLNQDPKKSGNSNLFGSWKSNETSEQLIEEIYSSRNFYRSIEKFE